MNRIGAWSAVLGVVLLSNKPIQGDNFQFSYSFGDYCA